MIKERWSFAPRKKARKTKDGFSLVELIVAIAILAVLTAVIAPSLFSSMNRSRQQRDTSAMAEVVSLVNSSVSDADIYDELGALQEAGNYSCYIDTPQESSHAEQKSKTMRMGDDEYLYNDDARQKDETRYFAAGNMHGITITFEPVKANEKSSKYIVNDGIVNKFLSIKNGTAPQRLGTVAPLLVSRLKASLTNEIVQSSPALKNSEYTIFVRMTDDAAIECYGQYDGYNLATGINNNITSDKVSTEIPGGNNADVPWPTAPIPSVDDGSGGDIIGGGSGGGITPPTQPTTPSPQPHEHTYIERDVVAPTCEQVGYTVYVCTQCNAEKTVKTSEMLGHQWEYKTVPETCTTGGYTQQTCSRCSKTEKTNQTQPLGHQAGAIETQNPTWDTDGYKITKCARCKGEISREIIKAYGKLTAYGVLTTDRTLMFIRSDVEPKVGSTVEGKVAKKVYKNVENVNFNFVVNNNFPSGDYEHIFSGGPEWTHDIIAMEYNSNYSQMPQLIDIKHPIRPLSMSGFFAYNTEADTLTGLHNVNTSKVNNMSYMFYTMPRLRTLDIPSTMDISKVTTMSHMFDGAESLHDLTINFKNTDSVRDMSYMFANTMMGDLGDTITLNGFTNQNVVSMSHMFDHCGAQMIQLNDFKTPNVTSMSYMFYNAGGNSAVDKFEIRGLSEFNMSNVQTTAYMFNMAGMFAKTFDIGSLSTWDLSNVIDAISMFAYAGRQAKTFNLDLSSWKMSKGAFLNNMFQYTGQNATEFSIGDLSKWDVSNVKDMSGMFSYAGYKATSFSIGNLRNWNVSKVTNMKNAFYHTGGLSKSFYIGDLSRWDVANVTDMSDMFNYAGCLATSFDIGDLSNWNVSNVTNMKRMFLNAGFMASWKQNLSMWNVVKVQSNHKQFQNQQKIIEPKWVA